MDRYGVWGSRRCMQKTRRDGAAGPFLPAEPGVSCVQPYARSQLLERVEREGATVGVDIPERIEIQGEEVDLRSFVFEIKRRDTIPAGEHERVDLIEEGDISYEEGEELARAVIGIDRALNALESLGPTDLEREQQAQEVADRKRWLSFLKKALGQDDDAATRRGR